MFTGILHPDDIIIGDQEIDADHQFIVKLIGKLQTETQGATNNKVAAILFTQLCEYADAHFKREEGLMVRINHKSLRHHASQHKTMMRTLNDIRKLRETTGVVGFETANMICCMFISHITTEDFRLRDHIVSMR